MKKISLMSVCLLSAAAAVAQVSVVKDAERALKAKIADYPKQVEVLKGAFTNPETAESAYPYFVAGDNAYKYFDNQQAMMQMGQNVDKKAMGHAIIDGYGFLLEALKRDTIVDAKGKTKVKYSKDAVKQINAHYKDFNNAGILLWEVQDYQGAIDAWELVFTAPYEPVLGANAPAVEPDSISNIIAFNQGLAAYNLEDWERTLQSFDRSIKLGNTSKNVFDYALAAAYRMPEDQRNALMAHYSELAYPIYGAEDNQYIGYIINEKLQAGKFDEARTMIDQYIKADPENAQLYYILGILIESNEKNANAEEEAFPIFEKCIALNPEHAQAYMQLGYLTYRRAEKMDEGSQSLSAAEYNKKRENEIDPVLRKAADYLEKAYQYDPENSAGALANLRTIYYNLNDAANLERIEKLQNQ